MEMNPVSKKALDWFNKNQRALPWRKSYDPYQVWVSEAILQQTRMEQGVPYFERFIQRFPTLESLAKAKPEQVLKAWEGLGYYHRAKNLHAAAKIIVEQHQAKIPTTKEELIRLPGFGPYIASAVASIAFEQDEAVVDGNVIRVISRLNAIEENVALPKTKKTIESIAREWLPTGKARNFNQALMELGALICSPRNPKCEICPIQSDCKAVALGKQESFPVKPKKKKTPTKNFAALYAQKNGSVLLHQRPKSGLLPGLWELPTVEFSPLNESELDLERKFLKEFGILPKNLSFVGTVDHAFTHFKQKIQLHSGTAEIVRSQSLKWVKERNVKKMALTKSTQKALEKVK